MNECVNHPDRLAHARQLCDSCYERDLRSRNPQYAARRKVDQPLRRRDNWFKRKYGISLDDYTQLLLAQGGGCALCGKTNKLNLDHSHLSGVVRGILCSTCNMAIGNLGDSAEGLNRALQYLLLTE